MTLTYWGQIEGNKNNTRVGELTFKESEERLAERIIDLMEKTTAWTASGVDDAYYISVDDKKDFEDLMQWYKEAKKSVKLWMKFGI